jgi:hypothetical protein
VIRAALAAAASRALVLALAALACGCGGATTPGAGRAVLEIRCRVPDAALWIDERYVAEVRETRGGIRLPAGPHRIEVRHDRFHAYYGEVALAPGERRRLVIELAEQLE